MGIGMIIKPIVIFEGFAFFLITGCFLIHQKNLKPNFILNWIIFGLCAAIPGVLILIYYYSIGHLDDLIFYNYTVSRRYIEAKNIWMSFKLFGDFLLRFSPFVFLFIYAFKQKLINYKLKITLLIWPLFILVGILFSGKFFGHYYIPLLAPLSLGAALVFGNHASIKHRLILWLTNSKIGILLIDLIIIEILLNILIQY